MPDADTPSLLCTATQFTEGPFADLVSQITGAQPNALPNALAEATRACEDATERRLAPFTMTETQRASGIDPDEYAATSNIPVSLQAALGMSEAASLSVTNLVRHHWLREYPPRYQDLWAYSGVAVTVFRSYGGNQAITTGQIISGPDDLGHIWFQLGQFIPVASYIQVTYSGGYTTVPASLCRAAKYAAASIIVRELDPGSTDHNPSQLWMDAMRFLLPFGRDGSPVRLMFGRGLPS